MRRRFGCIARVTKKCLHRLIVCITVIYMGSTVRPSRREIQMSKSFAFLADDGRMHVVADSAQQAAAIINAERQEAVADGRLDTDDHRDITAAAISRVMEVDSVRYSYSPADVAILTEINEAIEDGRLWVEA